MVFFRMPRFIRRYIRRKMHPMAVDTAEMKRRRLAILYAIIAWHAGGFTIYQMWNGNAYWPVTQELISKEDMKESIRRPAYDFAKRMGVQKAEVYRVGSLGTVKNNYNIKADENATSQDKGSDAVESK